MSKPSLLSTVVFSAALLLAGCGGFTGAEDAMMHNHELRHPISVQADIATLPVFVTNARGDLSDADRAAVTRFASEYKQRGHGPLTVATPDASYGSRPVGALVDLRDTLTQTGIGGDVVNFASYDAKGDPDAPILLSFKRFVAQASPCGNWSQDLAYDPSNGPAPNFGCASQHNLAAMIADPADLVSPRDMTPSDAQRRSVVLDKYRKGEVTSATRGDSDSAAVSEIGK